MALRVKPWSVFPAIAIFSFATTSFALIGETGPQIEARYGPTRAKNWDEFGNKNRAYRTGKYIVVVTFEKGVAVCESFFKEEPTRALNPEEIADLLVIYFSSFGTKWKASTTEPWRWDSADGKLRAVRPSADRLQISTSAYARKMVSYNNARSGNRPK